MRHEPHAESGVMATELERKPTPKLRQVAQPEGQERYESLGYRAKTLLLGPALTTSQLSHERVSKRVALAVFSSDPISSTAYATEEILLVLGDLAQSRLPDVEVGVTREVVYGSVRIQERRRLHHEIATALGRDVRRTLTAPLSASVFLKVTGSPVWAGDAGGFSVGKVNVALADWICGIPPIPTGCTSAVSSVQTNILPRFASSVTAFAVFAFTIMVMGSVGVPLART